MIPRIQTGNSFTGAGLYYLHDKKKDGEKVRLSTDRVAWTHAVNTLENDPEAVLAEMRQTARDQSFLKFQSGKRSDGRPTERTVMTVALAWSPEQSPSKEEMIAAGQSFLNHMHWQEHQVLYVAHSDTKHPHVHLIINRVHPEHGMTIDDAWSKIRSQKWALSYERERGRIYCLEREAKYGRDESRDSRHMTYRDWKLWQEMSQENAIDPEYKRALEAGEWEVLKDAQRDSRIVFWKETADQRKELRTALRDEVRDEFADEWAEYSVTKAERDRQAILYDREARRALRHYRKRGKLHGLHAVAQIKERQKAYHLRQREELFELRAGIAARQKERLEQISAPVLARLSADREATYKEILAGHRHERHELKQNQDHAERRRDLLSGIGQSRSESSLSPEQLRAYLEHARTEPGRSGDTKTKPQAPREDVRESPREATDRQLEKSDKDRALEEKRRNGLKWYLAKRERDRKRERDDDRER
jgi:hypothetical protein